MTNNRQVVLDTETTGLAPEQGHRIIEIGCVELVGRRLTRKDFHCYLQPDRKIDTDATKIHGITGDFLADKPRFADIADELINYLTGAELIIHNAVFDVAFLDVELKLWAEKVGKNPIRISEICSVTDTLAMARKLNPGQRNNLDALCKRYGIDQSERTLHGAFLDAELLANVYLAMTGGQVSFFLSNDSETDTRTSVSSIRRIASDRPRLRVVSASADENAQHQLRLEAISKSSGGKCLWS